MTGRVLAAALFALSIMISIPRSGSCGASASGRLSIEAALDTDRIAPGGTATLTVRVRSAGLNLPDVPLPPLPGVSIERGGTSQNFSMVNQSVERSSTTVYRLIPRAEGIVRIPPLRVTVGKDQAESSPLTLTVSRTAASQAPSPVTGLSEPGNIPSGTPELFVKATVDRSRAYWNEQIILRLRLYSRVELLGDVDWKPPNTPGFWTEGLGPPRQARAKIHGVEYAVMEIPIALFPTKTGTLTIGAARMRCRVARVIQPPDPWSLLAMPDVVPQDLTLTSDPVTVAVTPLPGGAPRGFSGAVGDYRLEVRVDGVTAHAGEPITAHATIQGHGNISTVRDPELRARGASRQYVAGSSTRIDHTGDRVGGEKETDVAFVADQPGAMTILPVAFAWFDPEAGRYRSQKSDSVRVAVLPGTLAESKAGQPSKGPVIAAPRDRRGPSGPLALDPPIAGVLVLGLSVLGYAAAVVAGRARQRRFRDPRHVRLRSMEALLARDLARAELLATRNDAAGAAALAEHALLAGVGVRYDVDLAGLAKAERIEALRKHGANDAEIASLEAMLDSLGAIAYAPPETRSSDARQAIRAVRQTLERYRGELSV